MAVSLEILAAHVGGTLVGGTVDAGRTILDATTLELASPDDVTLVDHADKLHLLAKSRAGAAIVPRGTPPLDRPAIEVDDVHAAFAAVVMLLRPPRPRPRTGVSPQAAVDPTARVAADVDIHPFAAVGADVEIGPGATIHSGARIMPGCRIGAGTEIFPNAVLYANTRVGDRCIIHANAVIGAYGFGYKAGEGGYRLSAQLGHVEIGDDCEIGAATTIDRGTYGPTVIGAGTKLDNLVMIAHNVRLGRHNMICSQVGVAGSTTTGDWVVMAGQVGVRDHVHIGDRAVLGARSGVSNDVEAGKTVLGEPAIDLRDRKLQLATLSKLPEMRKELKQLAARVDALAGGGRAAEAA
ncbi:MAG: UDP-3-O-(3-hydroxymyristoyl)glucosamine N-acyltransferase [Planctomycetia bacterium]|nr:UDP-3-O-(3-hydroxymyristoyl)glucosamine N-acyltransferase [Planctomycetia bacterium]